MNQGCTQGCLINAIAGIGDDAALEAFCGSAGMGVPGLIFPIPFATGIVAASASGVVTIDPLNDDGAVPIALLIYDDPVLAAKPTVRIDSIKDGRGDLVGLKGSVASSTTIGAISTTWPLNSFYGTQAVEQIKAGLPNLPPSIGLIDSSKPLKIAFTNTASGAALNLAGVVFAVIPRTR